MWSLYQKDGFLNPLKFSNGKTQEDIVKEVLESVKKGEKIIFIHGMCGTGKSAIALNIAKNLGKSSVIVPGKNLQNQYKKDYGLSQVRSASSASIQSKGDKYLLKENGEQLKIEIITGRNNHKCLFLQDSETTIPKFKKEVNSRLNDIFSVDKTDAEEKRKKDFSADNPDIPCKIEIKDKNFWKMREYLRKNKNVDLKNIQKTSDVKRLPLASVCPYWSPVLNDIYEIKNIEHSQKKTYEGLNGINFSIYKRKPGCGFYEQFDSYIDSDVIVFNAQKYKLESAMNRKPMTEAEIVDECDEFLDSFSNQRTINLDRLQNSMMQIPAVNESVGKTIDEIHGLIKDLRVHPKIIDAINLKKILPLKETPVYEMFRIFLESQEILDNIDEESYLFEFEETAKIFEDFFDETYAIFSKKENNFLIELVTTNLAKKIKEMSDKNKVLIFMSGTLHSESVLKTVFGLEKFEIIQAETEQLGKMEIIKTGEEFDCKYENFSSGRFTKGKYLRLLDKLVGIARKPTLIHVNAFNDLPNDIEIREFGLKNLISRDFLREVQEEDKEGKEIEKFKRGEKEILFTTRCARGVDFPGEQCNSIVFTKYPNPNPEEAFWKILKQTRPNEYWGFYKDKARRELLQKLYRGLRFKDDHVFVLSPDKRVLDFFESQKN